MQKLVIPIKTNDEKQKYLEISNKSSSLKKRSVKTWTADQDEKLIALYNEYPKKWNIISEMMRNRNQNQCLHRFRRICQLGQNKKIWSPQQDEVVLKMISQVGHNWRLIAQTLGTKSGKQIRQRFINKLDPNIRREQWTQEEDFKIIELFSQLGSKWCQISKCLPGRPENRIKNRFYSYIQKNYDFKVKDNNGHQFSQNKQNSPKTAGIKLITQKPHLSLQKKPSSRILQQRRPNSQQFHNQHEKQEPHQQSYQKIDEKENYNSMKEINDECFFKYSSSANQNDFLYFEDNQ